VTTILAITFTILGLFFFSRGGLKRGMSKDDPYTWVNNFGGYLLLIALFCWFFVFMSLLVKVIVWLWENAP